MKLPFLPDLQFGSAEVGKNIVHRERRLVRKVFIPDRVLQQGSHFVRDDEIASLPPPLNGKPPPQNHPFGIEPP